MEKSDPVRGGERALIRLLFRCAAIWPVTGQVWRK